ncbi:energy transducer TonB [Capnocytophaga granulosa]
MMNKDIQILLIFFLFPCIGYTQEIDTIPSMDIGEDESINTTCFPSMEQKPMFVQCKDVSAIERDACFYHFFSQYLKQSILKSPYKELEGEATVLFSVEKDGSVALIHCVASSLYIRKEVQRTMEQFPKLIPAQQWGKPVRYFYRCRIRLN